MGTRGHYKQQLALLLFDVLTFLAAVAVAMQLRFSVDLGLFERGEAPWGPMLYALPVMLGVWLMTLWSLGLYRVEGARLFREIGGICQAVLLLLGILLSLTFFYRGFSYSRGFALLFGPLLLAMTLSVRILLRLAARRIAALGRERSPILLVGDSPVARHLAEVANDAGSHLNIIGLLDNEAALDHPVAPGLSVIGRTSELVEVAERTGARGILITSRKLGESEQIDLLEQCFQAELEWKTVPSVYELMTDRVEFDIVAGVPVLGLRGSNIQGVNRVIKRACDMIVSLVLLALASPIMLVTALLVKLTSPGPVFYYQERIGQGGRPFRFFKFRSMRIDNDDAIHRDYTKKWIESGEAAGGDDNGAVFKIDQDPRLTSIGAFIRKYSIDELPQLLNVLLGDMSLVGPRPGLAYEVDVYRQWHRRRLEAPQGITGLWQVSGRNRLSFDEMVKLDIEYHENWSLGLDLRILWRTVGVVLFGKAY